MSEDLNQPKEYDAVLGGQNPPPINAAVLGGIQGVKKRLASSSLEVRINALSDALKYGEKGLDLLLQALQDDSIEVQFTAYSLLKDRQEQKVKQQLDNCLSFFEFEVVTVDAFGKINSRNRHFAQYSTEDLGKGIKLEMVAISGGTFLMGLSQESWGQPVHQVTIKPFFIGKYPITQEQWQAVMGNNPSHLKGVKRPVESVTRQDAIEFCAKLSQKTGKNYRLPSTAEWEYACRAGTTTPFHFGETITTELVNYDGKYPYGSAPRERSRLQTTPVGSFPPNAFGLYDMHGNVWEWCSDRLYDYYNGLLRGGSWGDCAIHCRSGHCGKNAVDARVMHYGFRVAVA